MSKGKKQAFTLIGLCLLMVAAICLYFFVPKGEQEETDENGTTESTITVVNIDSEKISEVHISGEEEITLTKDGESWKMEEIPKAPVDADVVEGMFTAIRPVTALQELDASESSLSEYGLDQPKLTVSIGTSDGKKYELKFGNEVPVSGGNYGLSGDSKKVYAFSDSLYQAFHIERNSLISREEIPEINTQYLTGISVKKGGKYTFKAEIVSDDKKVDAYTNWVISAPYERPLAGSSTEDWTTLQGTFTSVSFDSLVEYGCKDFRKYGLKNPSYQIQVDYFEVKDGYEIPEATAAPDSSSSQSTNNTNKANQVPEQYKDKKGYTLYVGNQAEDGSYYVRLGSSNQVYLLSADTAKSMIDVDAYTYMDRSVYSTLATDIKGYEVTIGKSGKQIQVTHSTQKGEDGKDKNVWTLNGKKVPEEQEEDFLTPYSKAFLLEFTSEAKDSVKPESDKPVLTMVFHEKDRDVTVKYLPYDGTNFYRVDKDGMDYFLVDKLSVDAVIEAFDGME